MKKLYKKPKPKNRRVIFSSKDNGYVWFYRGANRIVRWKTSDLFDYLNDLPTVITNWTEKGKLPDDE